MTPLGLKCNKTQLYRIRSNSCSHSVHILRPACTLLCNFPNSALHFVFTVWILTLRSLKKQVRVLKHFMQERLFFFICSCAHLYARQAACFCKKANRARTIAHHISVMEELKSPSCQPIFFQHNPYLIYDAIFIL